MLYTICMKDGLLNVHTAYQDFNYCIYSEFGNLEAVMFQWTESDFV